jgi:hypothetical protein
MSHPANYTPDYQIRIWPADDTSGLGTLLTIASGDVEHALDEPIREFTFELPTAHNDIPDDWADFASELLQRGSWVQVTVSEDGFQSGTYDQVIFWGAIVEVGVKRPEGRATISAKCQDPLMVKRGQGINLSVTTRMLIYTATWQHDGAEWNTNDPDFIVDVPDNLEEWVPQAAVSLVAYKTSAGVSVGLYEYERSEYAYSSGNKQIVFHNSQANRKNPAHDDYCDEWKFVLYYYDSTDTDTTVKKMLETVLTSDPDGPDGGCGFATGDVDLKPIVGFSATGIVSDAYGYWYATGTEKLVGTLVREKPDGTIVQFLEDLRDAGLVPNAYNIWYDPVGRKVRGRYKLQDDTAIVEPYFTAISDEQALTTEQLAGRCEVYAEATTLEDYAPGATITLVTPTFDDPHGGGYDGDPYTLLQSSEAVAKANLVDGKPDTGCSYWIELKNFHNPVPQHTADNFIVFDLLETKKVKRIQLTTIVPRNSAGKDWKIYFEAGWKMKVTISASNDPISATNPGIPVSAEAISVALDPRNPGSNGGLDVDVTCDWIWLMRYVAIRFDQDFYCRTSDNSGSSVSRCSWYGLSSVKILGDGYIKYLTGPDAEQVPFAEVTNQGGVISAHDDGAKTVTIPVAQAAAYTIGDRIALWDTTGGMPFGSAGSVYTDLISNINYLTGLITLTSAFPTELVDGTAATVANGDEIGRYTRWRFDLASVWQDFYCPLLWRKVHNTYNWLEVLPTEEVGDISEAEGMAVERLLGLIAIHRDHHYVTTLDLDLDVGVTSRVPGETDDWLISKCIWHLNPMTDGSRIPARVEMSLDGTNFDEVPQ